MGHPATKTFWNSRNILVLVVTFGVPILLFLGGVDNLLSPRGWAFGMIAWVVTLIILVSILKATKKGTLSVEEQQPRITDDARRRMLREIRERKIWIGVLVIVLPIGIVNGIRHQAWLPALGGTAISLMFMYVAMREIRQRRKKLGF